MDLITYGYNMAFLLLFSAVLSSCSTTYGLTDRRIYRYFAWLMFAFLLESALSAAVNIWTSSTPDTLFSRGGLLCDILNAADAAVEIYLVGAILYALFPPRRKTWAYAAAAAVLLGTLGILPGAVGAFLWRSIYSLASAALCGMYFHRLRCERDPAVRATALRGRRMVTVMLILSLLAVGEAALYTRYPREVMGDIFALYDRVCFSEDLFSVILAVRLLLLSREEKVRHSAQQMEQLLQQRMNEFQAREAERLQQDQRQQMEDFCRGYGLTEREREILRLILAGKDNLEISEELQIKMGTVKAHVHNIFTKLNISRRSELMKRFLDYGPEEDAPEPAPADQP